MSCKSLGSSLSAHATRTLDSQSAASPNDACSRPSTIPMHEVALAQLLYLPRLNGKQPLALFQET